MGRFRINEKQQLDSPLSKNWSNGTDCRRIDISRTWFDSVLWDELALVGIMEVGGPSLAEKEIAATAECCENLDCPWLLDSIESKQMSPIGTVFLDLANTDTRLDDDLLVLRHYSNQGLVLLG